MNNKIEKEQLIIPLYLIEKTVIADMGAGGDESMIVDTTGIF